MEDFYRAYFLLAEIFKNLPKLLSLVRQGFIDTEGEGEDKTIPAAATQLSSTPDPQ